MTLTDDQINQRCLFFIDLRTNKSAEEKINDIQRYVTEGGNINDVDRNDDDNSPLHIAVKRSEKDVVQYLVQNRAIVTQKNRDGKTPMDLALENNATDIIDTLKHCHVIPQSSLNTETKTPAVKKNGNDTSPNKIMFQKRVGTAGVGGQLYETKLLSLILMRAVNDKDIIKFCLASNLSLIGALDDIFFMYKVRNDSKVIVLALQAKHREDINKGQLTVNDLFRSNSDFSLPKYFDSYLKIKERLPIIISESKMAEASAATELNLVLYTPVKDLFDLKADTNNIQCEKIHKLIQTGKNSTKFQFKYTDEHINKLTRLVQEERIKLLGKTFLDFVMSPKKIDMMMIDPLMRKYHVVLSRKVIEITDKTSDKFIKAKFCLDFFNTNEDLFSLLRDTIFRETVQSYCKNNNLRKEEIVILSKKIIKEPTSTNLSDVIGKIVTYDDKIGKLKLIDSRLPSKEFNDDEKKKLRQDILNIDVTSSILYEAIKIAAKRILEPLEFKLPSYFGTFDLLKKNDNKMKKQLDFMATKFKMLFECENNIIKITESDLKTDNEVDKNKFEHRFFEISDGIGGAVGNLIIQDKETKMLKFNTSEVLPERANKLLHTLKSVLPEGKKLEEYRLKIGLKNFPRLSFLDDEYDKLEAEEFLNRLWFYTNQSKEDGVEISVKREVDKFYNVERGEDHYQFRIHSDAVYLRLHDEIQKWWMRPSDAAYLTKESDIFEKVKKDIINSPLLTVLKIMYLNKMKKINIEFFTECIEAMNLNFYESGIINIVTESILLTGLKVKQYYHNINEVIFIDFDYILSLPVNNYNSIFSELQSSNTKTLVIVYEPPKQTKMIHEKLKRILHEIIESRIIMVSDKDLGNELKSNFPLKYIKIEDKLNTIDQFVTKCQKKFLVDSTIIFQGQEVDLQTVLDEDSFYVLKPHIITKLINKNKIEIGLPVTNDKYEENKKYYINRYLRLDEKEIEVNTFQDIDDEVVVITAKPGMGKSTLLTHLSVEHKKLYSSSWIVRVDLADYLNVFETWKDNGTIDKCKCVKFLCSVALKSINNNSMFILAEKDSSIVILSHRLDELALLELELFLYYYNKNRIILLIHGFSDACPPYDDQVMCLLRTVRRNNIRIWIACSPYVHTINILENEFDIYSLEPINPESQRGFFYKFFSTNLKLEKLNHEQFMNISDFLEYFTGIDNFGEKERIMMPWVSLPLQVIYFVAIKYFKSEFNNITSKRISETFKEKYDFDLNKLTTLGTYLDKPSDEGLSSELAGTPLYMYLVANYFECKIKDKNKKIRFEFDNREIKSKWDLIENSFSLYKHFLESNIQEVCYGSARKKDQLEKRKDFFDKHKKLALLAICKEEHLKQLLTEDEIKETKSLVTRLQTGEERSDVVDCVLNKVPKFFHAMFAEYCVLDYVTTLMKKTDKCDINQHKRLWDVVVNVLLLNSPKSVRRGFDYHLKHDSEIAAITNTEQCRKIMFDLLLSGNGNDGNRSEIQSPLDLAVDEGLSNLLNVLVKSIEVNLNVENVTMFSEVVKKGDLLLKLFNLDYKDVGKTILKILRKKKNQEQESSDVEEESIQNIDELFDTVSQKLMKTKDKIQSHLKPETVDLIRGVCEIFKNVQKNNEE